MPEEFKPIGKGRFEGFLTTPWGQKIEAEVLVTTEQGWRERPESRDERWTAYKVGPAVVALRLVGEKTLATRLELPRSRVPAEWN